MMVYNYIQDEKMRAQPRVDFGDGETTPAAVVTPRTWSDVSMKVWGGIGLFVGTALVAGGIIWYMER